MAPEELSALAGMTARVVAAMPAIEDITERPSGVHESLPAIDRPREGAVVADHDDGDSLATQRSYVESWST
jgi:hypothetical protein